MVFDAIVSGPREESRSESVPEIEAGTALAIESADAEIEGEVIDPDDGDPSVGLDAEEIEAIDADGYTDADAEIMSESSGTTTSTPTILRSAGR